jgi:hypothetical protein
MKKELIIGLLISALTIAAIVYITQFSPIDHGSEDDLYSVEISGDDMSHLTVQDIADLWEIESEILLTEIINTFELQGEYTTNTTLEEMRKEYAFSPTLIKEIAEKIKIEG